jgi:MYXO-CTERM domain-containing protein
LVAAACVVGGTTRAEACGGFFCDQAQPVNQAAERIVFADNGDGTQTAVIEILYEGPSEHFSWLLPISSVPTELKVASSSAFDRLQLATDPRYSLNRVVEGECKLEESAGASGEGGASAEGGGGEPSAGGVHVEASGIVGAFDWSVISIDESSSDAASAAVQWLGDSGYDVPAGASERLGPYLEDGLHLLALKLTKGADTGAIRPIVLTYSGNQASIPIKLTAVSANENMGVLTWLLGPARAVPQNYLSLELNEARIDWFNPSSNYDDVVTAAADDAGGQGFVTELAAPADTLASAVWSPRDEQLWTSNRTRAYASFSEALDTFDAYYSGLDGYWDALKALVTLPSTLSWEQFEQCPNCYSAQLQNPPAVADLAGKIDELALQPLRDVQAIIDAHPHVTRLYTTMSADEMTTDPLFTFNPDLPDASNVHTADRVIECNPDVFEFQAPWRIELPQGGSVRGTASDLGSWPESFSSMPPNRVITRSSDSGPGKTIEDNSDAIEAALDAYNATRPPASTGQGGGGGGTSSKGGGGKGGAGKGGSGTQIGGGKGGIIGGGAKGGTSAVGGGSGGTTGSGESDGEGGASEIPLAPNPDPGFAAPGRHHGGCAVTPGASADAGWSGLFGFLLLGWRRRRRT